LYALVILLSNQNGKDNAAKSIARPIDTIIKSISQARNLSVQLARSRLEGTSICSLEKFDI
jgi:hypothetical protein